MARDLIQLQCSIKQYHFSETLNSMTSVASLPEEVVKSERQ